MEFEHFYQAALIGKESIRRSKADKIKSLGNDKELQELRDITKMLQTKMESYATTATSAVEKFKKS